MTQFYQEELKTNKGNIFTINSIKWIRFKHKIPSINLIKEGEFSINQIVEKFNVSHHVVRYWIDKGIVQARFIKTKIWISLDDTKENELKQRAEKAIKRLALLSKTLNKIERGTL